MADHLTEEEQIEALKRWWSENWLTVILPIFLVAAGYIGWNFWKDNNAAQAEKASDKYELMLSALEAEPGKIVAEEKKKEAMELATTIVAEHSKSLYADLSRMILARFAVEDGKLDEAENFLQQVIKDGANEAEIALATARLAKVYYAQDKHEEALSLIAHPKDDSFKSLYAEIRGDIYVDQDKKPEANTAYQEAMNNLAQEQMNRRNILQIKLDSTKVADISTASIQPEPVEEEEAPVKPEETKTGDDTEGEV